MRTRGMTNGGNGGCPECPEHKSFWPSWHGNTPFALVLLLIGAFTVVYLMARITQIQTETKEIGKPMPYEHQITVDGQGRVVGTPDVATVSMSVETKGDDVAATQTQNSATMTALIEKIKALGVAAADVQTSSYSVYENTVWNAETQTYDANGWVVSQSLTVKVRDTAKIASVLETAGQNGATNIYGPNFEIDDTTALKNEAREEAMQKAQEKAMMLASKLGVRLEKVVGYSEWEDMGPYPYYDGYMVGESSASLKAAPAIEAGSQEVTLNVSITYKLVD